LYLSSPEELFAKSEKKTRVVLIRNKDVLDYLYRPRENVVRQMLDEAVMTLLNEKDPVRAWKRLVKPADIVGVKSNEWRFLPTPWELESVIKQRIMDAGVSKKNIGIDDRGVLENSRFLNATALINVRPLRTHHWAGVGSLIKNYIMFVKEPSDYHPDSCADLASIWKLPLVHGKTRLNILILFTPLVGVRILLAKRREYFGEVRPLNPPPKHIFLADTRHRLGRADPEKIDLVKVGWKEGIFI
jgi:hypothetical protein